MSDYRLFVNDERTVLVRIWPDGPIEVATREDSSHTWGPPVLVQDDAAPSDGDASLTATASAPEGRDA